MQIRYFFCLSIALLLLGGCENTSDFLGSSRRVPDEFSVVQYAPLEVPPSFMMRPPMPGAKPKNAVASSEEAQNVLFDKVIQKNVPHSSGKMHASDAFLNKVQSDTRDPEIRHKISSEVSAESGDENFMKKLAFWKETTQKGDVIDPLAEKERLRHPN